MSLALLSVVAVTAGCSSSKSSASGTPGGTSSSTSGGASASAGGPSHQVNLYSIDSLTGASAAFGSRTEEGAKLEVNAINAAGGFNDSCGAHYTIKLTSEDMANSADQAVSLLRQAAADPSALAVIGPSPSTGWVPMIPLAGSLKIPVMATGAGATVKTWNPYTYRINVTPPVADPAMMKLLVQKFNIKRLAIIYDETNDGQTTDANIFSSLASSLGYTVVSKQAFKSGDTDVRAQLTSIKAANPDWVAYDAQITDLGLVVNQATEVGLGNLPKLTGFSQWDDPTTWDLTKGAVNGGYSWAPSKDPSSSDADIQAYDTMYKAATGEPPTKDSLYGHDVVDLYVNAVKQSCTATDRVKFNDALHKTSNFSGLSGVISFDPTMADGENHAPAIKVTKTVGKGMSVAVTP